MKAIELRQGAGAFVARHARGPNVAEKLRTAQPLVAGAVNRLRALKLTDEEIRRLFEAELARLPSRGLKRAGGS